MSAAQPTAGPEKLSVPGSTLRRDPSKGLKRGEGPKADPEKVREFERRGRRNSKMGKDSKGRPARAPISPASDAQKAKVAAAVCCVACGRERSEWLTLDPAHVAAKSKSGCDSELCVLPLCRAGDGSGCHREFDDGKLDLLKVIAGTWPTYRPECAHALEHLSPVGLIEQLANARTQWRG